MAERRAAGHVREGHGDLHLGNLLWLYGRPVLLDATYRALVIDTRTAVDWTAWQQALPAG